MYNIELQISNCDELTNNLLLFALTPKLFGSILPTIIVTLMTHLLFSLNLNLDFATLKNCKYFIFICEKINAYKT